MSYLDSTMCGRATLSTPARVLEEVFGLSHTPELTARYNVAPTQPVAVVRHAGQLELLRWGLVLQDAPIKGIGINVRVESASRVPAYRGAMRGQRCLILVDGFYEWKHSGGKKEPWHIHYPRPSAVCAWRHLGPRRKGGRGRGRVVRDLDWGGQRRGRHPA